MEWARSDFGQINTFKATHIHVDLVRVRSRHIEGDRFRVTEVVLLALRIRGKSHTFAMALILRADRLPHRALCCREIQRSMKESVKYLLDGTVKRLGLEREFISTNSEITSRAGAQILFEGLRSNVTSVVGSYRHRLD
jgi:phage terminase large subunit